MDTTPIPVLTDEQRRVIASQPREPVRLLDPSDNTVYVLLRAEIYDAVRELFVQTAPADAYGAVDRTFAEGWSDPRMDDYDRYEDVKQ